MQRQQQGYLMKTLGVLWPLLCAVITASTLFLIRVYLSQGAFSQLKEIVWWPSGLLAVTGSVAAGVISARDHERGKAAIAFGAWATVVFYFAFCVHAVTTGERQ